MEDFASSLGLTISQRERLLQQLGVEDQELLDAKQLAPWAGGDTPVRAPKKIAGLTPANGWNMTVKMQLSPGEKNGKMRRRLVNMGVDHVLPVNMRI